MFRAQSLHIIRIPYATECHNATGCCSTRLFFLSCPYVDCVNIVNKTKTSWVRYTAYRLRLWIWKHIYNMDLYNENIVGQLILCDYTFYIDKISCLWTFRKNVAEKTWILQLLHPTDCIHMWHDEGEWTLPTSDSFPLIMSHFLLHTQAWQDL